MEFKSRYQSKQPDEQGFVAYTDEEDETWGLLYHRMMGIVERYACKEYLQGLKVLDLPTDHIPQLPELSKRLGHATGWAVEPVPALIPLEQFFDLLAHQKFPAATFIRRREELDYLQEPDIFHEIFGHCPLLTNPYFANFTQQYGKLASQVSESDALLLQRLYWFTVEFGLIQTNQGMRNYGGGILSSYAETQYSIDSDIPKRLPLGDGVEALRTPYRIDIMQPVYFYIGSFKQLYALLESNPTALIQKARDLGEHEPLFEMDIVSVPPHIRAC